MTNINLIVKKVRLYVVSQNKLDTLIQQQMLITTIVNLTLIERKLKMNKN